MATGTGAAVRTNRIGEGDNPSVGVKYARVQFDRTLTFSNNGAAIEFATSVIAGLPVGDLLILGGVLHLDLFENTVQANISDTFTATVSLGTTPTADNNLTSPATDQDILIGAAITIAAGGVAPHLKRMIDGAAVVAGLAATADGYIDNNAGDKEVNLNVTLPDADVSTGSGSLRARGSLILAYVAFGKNA